MKRWWIGILLWLAAAPVGAQIWGWQDAEGVRRFTNQRESIPEEYRDQAKVLVRKVDEPADVSPPAAPKEQGGAAAKPAPRMAQVVYDEPPPSTDYLQGVADGMQRSQRRLDLDLERLTTPAVVVLPPINLPPSYYPQPIYSPWITTPFDGGRTRHRTLRMALQDQLNEERYPWAPWEIGYINGIPLPNWVRYPEPSTPKHPRGSRR